jgi:hypothetical protein
MDTQHYEARYRVEMLERAASYPGRARERLIALAEADEICARLYPCQDQAVRAIRIAAQALPERPRLPGPARDAENRLIDILRSIADESLTAGELCLPQGMTAEQAAVGIWTLAFGRRAVHLARNTIDPSNTDSTVLTTRGTLNLLADCLDWRPLSSEWDYRSTRDRVLDHLGTAEVARAYTAALQDWREHRHGRSQAR